MQEVEEDSNIGEYSKKIGKKFFKLRITDLDSTLYRKVCLIGDSAEDIYKQFIYPRPKKKLGWGD